MNMQQRKYLIKKRLDPLQADMKTANRQGYMVFRQYVCWGDLIRKIESGELRLQRSFYHKSIRSGNLYTSYDNPFGEKGSELLSDPKTGIVTDGDAQQSALAEWNQRFTHATDFIMLASAETICTLLHNLEAAVKAYAEDCEKSSELAYTKRNEYIEWLEEQGADHDYEKRKQASY